MRNTFGMKVLALAAAFLTFALPEVKCTLEAPKTAKAGAVLKGNIVLDIPEGSHAFAPPAKNGELIVTVASVSKGFRATFPPGQLKKFPGLDEANVYEGMVRIPFQLPIPKGAKGKFNFTVQMRTQLCSNSEGQCYPPKTETLKGSVTINPGTKIKRSEL